MAETPEELTQEELERADGEPLPEREAMSVIRGPVEYPLPSDDWPSNPPGHGVIPIEEPQPHP